MGETDVAVVDSLVKFRANIRRMLLDQMKLAKKIKKNSQSGISTAIKTDASGASSNESTTQIQADLDASTTIVKNMLTQCDDLRDHELPSLGIKIEDRSEGVSIWLPTERSK